MAKRKTKLSRLPAPSRRRTIRVCAGVTLDEMGEFVGVSGEAVRLWETGQRVPSDTHRDDYIDVLDELRAG